MLNCKIVILRSPKDSRNQPVENFIFHEMFPSVGQRLSGVRSEGKVVCHLQAELGKSLELFEKNCLRKPKGQTTRGKGRAGELKLYLEGLKQIPFY